MSTTAQTEIWLSKSWSDGASTVHSRGYILPKALFLSDEESLVQPVSYYYSDPPNPPVHYTYDVVARLPDRGAKQVTALKIIEPETYTAPRSFLNFIFTRSWKKRPQLRHTPSITNPKYTLDSLDP